MKLKTVLLSGLFCFGLVIGTATVASGAIGEFQAIEHPLEVKLGVTAMGLGLVVLDLWWFLTPLIKSKDASHN